MKPGSFSSCWHLFMEMHWKCYNLGGWVLDEYFIVSPSLTKYHFAVNQMYLILACHPLWIILFFPTCFLFMLLALIGLSWDAVSHIPFAIIALRQIAISTGDIAQSNMLLFIRMGVWQQIIPVPLFPSFKVMMEFTNPYWGVSEHALHFLHSTQLKCKDEEKSNLLWVWHYAAVTSACRCSERSFIFITHQKLQIYNQTWKPSVACQRNDTLGNKQAANSEILCHISSLHSGKVCPFLLYSVAP